MCLTANSTRVCAGSICQIVVFSTCGAILAVIGVPPYGAKHLGRPKRALVLPGVVAPAAGHEWGLGSALCPPSTRRQRAVSLHSGPGRVPQVGVSRRGRVPYDGALESARSASDRVDILIIRLILYFV